MRWNSRVLWVTTQASSANAWQAIHRSLAPKGMVDTRRFTAAPVVEAIAEARQSYLSQVSFGYTGALSVRLVEPEPRCTAHPDAP